MIVHFGRRVQLKAKKEEKNHINTRDIPVITQDIYLWHNGRIGHAKIPDAVHPQSIVDHSHGIIRRTHLAGTRLMILRAGVLAHGAGPIFLAQIRILRACGWRFVVQSHIVLDHGTGIGERQRDLDTFDEDHHVHRIAQVVAPNDRLRKGIVTSETQLPCGQVRLLAAVNRWTMRWRAIHWLSKFTEISRTTERRCIDYSICRNFPGDNHGSQTSLSYHSRVKLRTKFWYGGCDRW